MKKQYNFSKAKRATARKGLKIQKSFRLDPEVLLWLEEEGERHHMGYQTFLNWFLKNKMTESKTVEERLSAIELKIKKRQA